MANGEVGIVTKEKNRYLNVIFAGRPYITVGYSGWDFQGGKVPLELAYALTVHKVQGSEFKKVFVILPQSCWVVGRELIYTALTRSKEQLVLLIEGDNAGFLYELTKPGSSEVLKRNTNLFYGSVREKCDSIMYAEHLIHRTKEGVLVRSKSELVIGNILEEMGIRYTYERSLKVDYYPKPLHPDFSFETPSGELILWEHLGMLGRPDYRRGWELKKECYGKNGYVLDKNLFTTQDDERGGLDSRVIEGTAERIKNLL